MKFHLLKSIPFVAAAALAFAGLPLRAGPPIVRGGGGGAVHAHSGGGSVTHGGGGIHINGGGARPFVHNGGASSGGGHTYARTGPTHTGPTFRGGSTFRGPAFRGPRYHSGFFVGSAPYINGAGSYPYYSDGGSDDYPYADADSSGSDDTTVYPSGASTVPNMAVSVQIALANAGYYNGVIDGVIGPGSMAAISAFQRTHNLPVTGLVDIYLLHALGLY